MTEAYIKRIDELEEQVRKLRTCLTGLVETTEHDETMLHYYRFKGVRNPPTLKEYKAKYPIGETALGRARAALTETETKK